MQKGEMEGGETCEHGRNGLEIDCFKDLMIASEKESCGLSLQEAFPSLCPIPEFVSCEVERLRRDLFNLFLTTVQRELSCPVETPVSIMIVVLDKCHSVSNLRQKP